MELEAKVDGGAARATRRRGGGPGAGEQRLRFWRLRWILLRAGAGEGRGPGERQTLIPQVRLIIPSRAHRHVPCSRIWGPCRPATSHVGFGADVDAPRSI